MTAFLDTALAAWLDVAAASLILGASLFPLYAPTGRFLDRRLRWILIGAAAAEIVAILAATALLAGAQAGAEPGFGFRRAAAFLATDPGSIALVRLALSAFMLAMAICLRRNSWTARPQGRILAAVAGCALIVQASSEAHPPAAPLAHVLHAIAAGAWLGGLVPLGLVLAKAGRCGDAQAAATAGAASRRFAAMRLACVAAMLLTGACDMLARSGAGHAPLATFGDRPRLVELGLVLAAGGLAAAFRRRRGPAAIWLEAGLGACILAAAAAGAAAP